MHRITLLFLLFPLAVSAQEDCELFNLQDLAAENLALHDSIAQFSLDTVILQPDSSFHVLLNNGIVYDLILGCTNPAYLEYDAEANTDDGSCKKLPCVSPTLDNYNYDVVGIGDQCWFAENLRTTTYVDGTIIPSNLSQPEWIGTTEGATAVYGEGNLPCQNSWTPDFDSCDETLSLPLFGRLYNGYAVVDPRGLCPNGWHVPSNEEWNELSNYVSTHVMSDVATALKSTSSWGNTYPGDYGNGIDAVGFNGYSSGMRTEEPSVFSSSGLSAPFWSTEQSGASLVTRYLYYYNTQLTTTSRPIGWGHAVRCIRDN